jgi:signal transduction histidine kinase
MKLLKYCYLWLLLILVATGIISAQNNKVDSLSKLVNDSKDTSQVIILNDLCFSLYSSKPELALEYGLKAIKLGKEINYKRGLATAYNRVGIVYDVTGKYEDALQNYSIALLINNEIGNEINAAGVQNNIGMIYWNKGDYAKALEYYFKSVKVLEKLGNDKMLANVFNNIGLIYDEAKQLDKSLEFHEQALALRRKIDDKYGISASLSNLALLYNDSKEYDKALQFYNESLTYKEALNDDYGLGIVYKGLASVYENLDNSEKAIEYYEKAIEVKKKVNDQYGLGSTYLGLAIVYYGNKDFVTASKYYTAAKDVAEKINSNKLLYKTYNGMALVNNQLGNYKEAYEYMKKHATVYDKVFNEEKSKQFSELQTKYETEKKEQAIAILNRDNEIQQLQLKRKNLQLTLIGIGSIIILLIMGIFYQRYRIKQQKILQDEKVKQQQLRLKAIIETQETERNRISKDLHDGIGQLLAATKINLSAFDDKLIEMNAENREIFEHSTKILNEAITEVSSISQQMMPRTLRESGLVPAVENLLDKTLSKTNIKYNFQQISWNGRLAENIEVGLYRIMQELIGNITKHARATEVNVQLTKTKKNIILTVEDNGVGIPKDLHNKGMGLDNITSRAESLGGFYHYESEKGFGTISTVRIPI